MSPLPTPRAFIVSFTDWASHEELRSSVGSALHGAVPHGSWSIRARPPAAQELPTDFVSLQLNSQDVRVHHRVSAALLAHPDIASVFHERHYSAHTRPHSAAAGASKTAASASQPAQPERRPSRSPAALPPRRSFEQG
jgi:hypothetical protein